MVLKGSADNTQMTGERVLEGEILGPETEAERAGRERLRFLAWLLDSSIPVPGTRLTVGLDFIVGLVPVVGDLLGVLASSLILVEANRMGVPRSVLSRMALNVAVEGVVGMIPFAGDLFDAGWKANQRNVRLLEQWLGEPHRAQRSSGLLVAGIVLGLAALVALCAAIAWLGARALAGA
jgi:hypothetical protein